MPEVKGITFKGFIIKHLTKLWSVCDSHIDQLAKKTNTDKALAEAYFWDEVESYAKKQSEQAWKRLEDEVTLDKDSAPTGESQLVNTPNFYVRCKKTNPVKRFNADECAKTFNKKFKVPIPIAKEIIEGSKLPTTSQVSLAIVEK